MLGSAWVVATPISTAHPISGTHVVTDPELYRHIIADMRNGDSYYQAAATEQRQDGYPLKPFVAMRLATLAWLSVALGETGLHVLFLLLSIAATLAWFFNPALNVLPRPLRLSLVLMIALSQLLIWLPTVELFHEAWAATLIALSLGLWRPKRIIPAVITGLTAALFRETAIAYLLLMAFGALFDRRPRELLAWVTALCVMAIVLMLHASQVQHVVRLTDASSPGWHGQLGWGFFMSAATSATPLVLLPVPLAHALIALSLFGWAMWRNSLALRVIVMLGGYALMIMLFARADTFYWALLETPLLISGVLPASVAVNILLNTALKADSRLAEL